MLYAFETISQQKVARMRRARGRIREVESVGAVRRKGDFDNVGKGEAGRNETRRGLDYGNLRRGLSPGTNRSNGRLGSKTERASYLEQVAETGRVEAVDVPGVGASDDGGDIEGVLIGKGPSRPIGWSVEHSNPAGKTSCSSSMSYEACNRKEGTLRFSFKGCPCTLTIGVWFRGFLASIL